eukprot:10289172-Lingulodinium_polyedra.AAC.1
MSIYPPRVVHLAPTEVLHPVIFHGGPTRVDGAMRLHGAKRRSHWSGASTLELSWRRGRDAR